MRKIITEPMLDQLRGEVVARLSEKRAYHTLCVEQMVARLAALYCPEEALTLRGAALLHDLTKEKKAKEQEALCKELGIPLSDERHFAPKTYHAVTAAALIERDYPDFADEVLLSAVRWHTTGRAGMTTPEKLLYLADYIDDSRTFPDCVALRREFFDAEPEKMAPPERLAHLRRVLLHSYRLTVRALLDDGLPIAHDTTDAMNELIIEELKEKETTERKPQ